MATGFNNGTATRDTAAQGTVDTASTVQVAAIGQQEQYEQLVHRDTITLNDTRQRLVRKFASGLCALSILGGAIAMPFGVQEAQAQPLPAPIAAQVDHVRGQVAHHARGPLNQLEAHIGAHPAIDQARGVLGIAPERATPAPAKTAMKYVKVEQQVKPEPAQSKKAVSANQAVVDAAMSRQGSPYVYGAAGPNAFDCSGLVYWAHAQAGKSIPRTSQAQLAGGRPVSLNALQPGDVIGYYPGVTHVGLYIGNGMVVHASTPGTPVGVVPMYSMPVVGAARF